MLLIWSKFLTGLDFVSLDFVYLVYVGRKMAFYGLEKIQKGPQLNSMPLETFFPKILLLN